MRHTSRFIVRVMRTLTGEVKTTHNEKAKKSSKLFFEISHNNIIF